MTRFAAIVAHGQPGDPGPLQADLDALAAQVAPLLPGWRVAGATLAMSDSLTAIRGVELIYPMFMADGWFVQKEMPRRLAAAGVADHAVLPPFGLDPALPGLGARLARQGAQDAGLDPARTVLVVAGHGSQVSRGSARSTNAFAGALAPLAGFARVECGFVEEEPFLADLRPGERAICLPFFATNAGHVREDIPEAWAQTGALGPVLPPLGLASEIPALIAAALERGMR